MHTIATWYYEQTADEGGTYAQVPWSSSSEAFRDVYKRCLTVFFTCARGTNPTARLVLFVNHALSRTGTISSQVVEALQELDVEIEVISYDSRPADTWPHAWRNQFFVLDALRRLASDSAADDLVVLLDSDVCWTSTALGRRFWSALASRGCLTYDLGLRSSKSENGLNDAQLGELYTSLTGQPTQPLTYIGGELQACRGDVLRRLSSTADELWGNCQQRWSVGLPTIGEEAHLLTLAYRSLGVDSGGANEFLKRCWTQRLNYRNVDGTEAGLAMWHVPSEKRFGIRRLYRAIHRAGPSSWIEARSDGELRPELSRYLGIPKSGPSKEIRDVATRIQERLDRRGLT